MTFDPEHLARKLSGALGVMKQRGELALAKLGDVLGVVRQRATPGLMKLSDSLRHTPKGRLDGRRVTFAALLVAAIVLTGFNVATTDGSGTDDGYDSTAIDSTRDLDDQAARDKERGLDNASDQAVDKAAKEQEQAEKEAAERKAAEEKAKKEAAEPKWTLPSKALISDVFGPRAWRAGVQHDGTDFAADEGEDNYAAFDGTVVQAGPNGGYGNFVLIEHGDGVETWYGHFSDIDVEVGQKVESGQVLGQAGSTGDVTGPHLHFEVHVDGNPVDPVPFLQKHGVDL
ncbi:M23 family metallopeptidase [Phytomonospora sp. NPDC050363]|uniref:M23 family metallopeptidase n=1 Tax=Phytomonospora sp. NPDC050363 TaxID=3155642 RepID=UPI0033F4F0F7